MTIKTNTTECVLRQGAYIHFLKAEIKENRMSGTQMKKNTGVLQKKKCYNNKTEQNKTKTNTRIKRTAFC